MHHGGVQQHGCHNRYLESHDEDAERVQHSQTDLRGHVGLQQALAAHVRICMTVHCTGSTGSTGARSLFRFCISLLEQ